MEDNLVRVICVNNGPARIEGKFVLVFPDGTEEMIDGRRSICRCGMSALMPICDGSHKNCVPRHDDALKK